jgi:hypothetical protein
LASARGRPLLLGLAVALVVAVAGWVQDVRQVDRSTQPEPQDVRRTAAIVRSMTRPNELVASDLPIVAYLADRRQPGDLVDTSAVRFASGSLKPNEVQRPDVRVYVAGREFNDYPQAVAGLSLARRVGSIRILVSR